MRKTSYIQGAKGDCHTHDTKMADSANLSNVITVSVRADMPVRNFQVAMRSL